MTKLTTYRTNPIANIEQALDRMFNLTPVFHNLEEVYKTGDQVRFANREDALHIQIDMPGCGKGDLELNVDTDQRDIFINGKRTIKTHDGEEKQTMNRSFSIGREYDLNKVVFEYTDGVLEVTIPRRKKEEYVKKYTL